MAFELSINKKFAKKLKSSHAFIGDQVFFERKNFLIEGIVVDYRENSVIVEIGEAQAEQLGLNNCLTVVNHRNYKKLGAS